ncbi:MAG: hypothetical protein Q9168_004115 [Polycauliona sp. 1 TL-2023]
MDTSSNACKELVVYSDLIASTEKTDDVVPSTYSKTPSPLVTNIASINDPVAWMRLIQLQILVRENHRVKFQSLRDRLKARFCIANYHSHRLEKRGEQPNTCQALKQFMASIEDVRVKMDVCVDKLNILREWTPFLTEVVDGKTEFKKTLKGVEIHKHNSHTAQCMVGAIYADGSRSFDGYKWDKLSEGSRILGEMLSRLSGADWLDNTDVNGELTEDKK